METRKDTKPEQTNKLICLPTELYEWCKARAIIEDRSANSIIRRAIIAYRAAREISND
jgi:hypothetical protein